MWPSSISFGDIARIEWGLGCGGVGNFREATWGLTPGGVLALREKKRPLVFFALFSLLWAASYDGLSLMPPLAACHCNSWCVLSMLCSLLGNAIRAIKGLVWPLSPYSVGDGLDWRRHNEDDGEWHSNITFIERRHTCWTKLLKNDDGRTDGRAFSSPPPPVEDRPDEAALLALHDGDWLAFTKPRKRL